MITTVIFDLSEVYLHGLLGTEHRIAPLVYRLPQDVFAQLKGPVLTDFFHGKISEEEYWRRTAAEYDWPLSVSFLKQAVRDNFTEIPGTRAIIEDLRTRGVRLGLLSVHAREWVDYCQQRFRYHELFDARAYSFEAGVSKPDLRAYQEVVERLSVFPSGCVYIDDQEENLQVPRKMGMHAIRFHDAAQLRRDLARSLF